MNRSESLVEMEEIALINRLEDLTLEATDIVQRLRDIRQVPQQQVVATEVVEIRSLQDVTMEPTEPQRAVAIAILETDINNNPYKIGDRVVITNRRNGTRRGTSGVVIRVTVHQVIIRDALGKEYRRKFTNIRYE